MSEPYDLRWARAARHAIEDLLPESVAAAVLELARGPLRENPYRVGKPLQEPFLGLWSARRATYRVTYRIDDDKHLVTVETVRHRRDAYRR